MKIVLQGGGAKLLTLLSAVHGVQKLTDDGQLSFSEVSGSSAGSIAGLVLALGLPADRVREHFKQENMRRRLAQLKPPSKADVFWKTISGSTVLRDSVIKEVVYEIFSLAGIKDDKETISLKYPLKVTVTDIHNQEVDFFSIEGKSLKEGVQTVVDSCAIPIIFRNHNDTVNADKADGGLFENFPTSKLVENYDPNRVMGLSFRKDYPNKPFRETSDWKLSQYVGKVISAAINANISASLRELPEENVIQLPSDFDMLSFDTAINEMLLSEKRHLEISDLTYSKTTEIMDKIRGMDEKREWSEKTLIPFTYEQMTAACADLLKLRRNNKLDLDAKVYVELNSQCSESDPAYKNGFDTFYQKMIYKVPEEGIDCLGVVISEYENEAEFAMYADIIARDEFDNKLPLVVLPAKPSDLSKGFKVLVIMFKKCLLPGDTKTITLIQRELIKDQFTKIATEGWDYMEYSPATQGKIENLTIAFGVPAEKASLYYIEAATSPYSKDSEEYEFTDGSVTSETSWLDEIATPGIKVLSVEAKEATGPDKVFTALLKKLTRT
ncbi:MULTISPECIES: patatin-like phospholipase family protein [unclassified Ruegeria]|uniref:patatin-like phospholipase family protein n=1 Tax=unclassified Ruegeria TaxID=2625375 RepID=UPI001492EC19|nr:MULTISPECIES: patatin-like phospholipase family protein [unclassified Ruegeria]NOC84297.1 hypothetical protein [Ruegeria sp. HKCCD6428]NOD86427.1 hypothetical protein [Ruegeria sp. HKCCD6119]